MSSIKCYKLFRKMKDGYAPLFINKRQRIQVGVWYPAENHPTKGFAQRFGWHATLEPTAPHIKEDIHNRVWCECEIRGDWEEFQRPHNQGGTWLICRGDLRIIREL